VPVLVVHGTEDRILPFEATVRRLPGLVQDLTFVQVEAGPHNIGWTHPDEVNGLSHGTSCAAWIAEGIRAILSQ
jgi:pimeloyl-ACP methyl ester carboxylesterase